MGKDGAGDEEESPERNELLRMGEDDTGEMARFLQTCKNSRSVMVDWVARLCRLKIDSIAFLFWYITE